MADNSPGGSSPKETPSGGKAKAQKKQASTEANPYLDPYKFTDEEDTAYQTKVTEATWQADPPGGTKEDRVLPRPPWATLIWGPLPLQENKGYVKKLIKPGSGGARKKGDAGERTDDEVRHELYQAWSKSTTKIRGSRNLVIVKTSDLGPTHVVPYLGFPDHGALAAFALSEGMSWIFLPGVDSTWPTILLHADQATHTWTYCSMWTKPLIYRLIASYGAIGH